MNDITSNGRPVRLEGPVDLGVVRVTIGPDDRTADAVHLADTCTGHIRSIVVEQHHGDGIKIGVGAHDLEIDNVHVVCYAKDDGKHQDGIQVMGGKGIHFHSGYVSAFSANNSQILIHAGAKEREIPEDVIFDNFVVDPQGSGAYGVSNGKGIACGFTNLTLLSRSNNHDLWQGSETQNPQWSFAELPPGVRSNFDRTVYAGG